MVQTPIAWAFQGGRRRVVAVSATAGNAIKAISPTAGKRWLVLFGRINLVADANTANRNLYYYLTDGTNTTLMSRGAANITAGQTRAVSFAAGVVDQSGVSVLDYGILAFPETLILEGVDTLTFACQNGLVGDSFSGYVVVMEVDV